MKKKNQKKNAFVKEKKILHALLKLLDEHGQGLHFPLLDQLELL